MSEIINVTFSVGNIIVDAVTSPVSVNVPVTVTSPVISITASTPQSVAMAVESVSQSVVVEIGQGSPGPIGPAGPAGANAQVQILTLAAYLALTPEAQMNGTWYVIPKA